MKSGAAAVAHRLEYVSLTTMAQPLKKPLRNNQHAETILRSGHTLQHPAASAIVATAS